jgi:hypothetical protein
MIRVSPVRSRLLGVRLAAGPTDPALPARCLRVACASAESGRSRLLGFPLGEALLELLAANSRRRRVGRGAGAVIPSSS